MDSNELPPIIGGDANAETKPAPARWRWCLHLLVLALFPLSAGMMGILRSEESGPLLPKNIAGLLRVSFFELLLFGVIFAIAWLASRANGRQLLLNWRGGARPILLGLAYSVALRMAIMMVLLVAVIFWVVVHGMPPAQSGNASPLTKHIVDISALTQNPIYFVLALTLISFVVAGLREELWRAAMLAGLNALFPRQFEKLSGQAMAVMIVAVLFGMGHTAEGWAGVAITALLGFGLGAIMLWHRSIWEAVFAHGFFDAGTFALLYLLARYFPHQF